MVLKQHKEYRKKDLQSTVVEGPTSNIIDVLGGTNAGSLSDQLDSDKTNEGDDDFAYMPPLEDASDHDRSPPRQGLSTPISDKVWVLEPGMVGDSHTVILARGFDSQLVVDAKDVMTSIGGHHVEVLLLWMYRLHHVMPLLGWLTHLGKLKLYS